MELFINNQTRNFDFDELTVQALLDIESPQKQKGIAVAVNNHVIPRTDWNSQLLNPTDQILIISATQGG